MYFFRDSVINEESHQSVIKIFMRLILATVLVLSTCTVECFILGSGPTCIRSHVRDQCLSTSKFYQQQDSESIDGFNISRRDAALLTISGVVYGKLLGTVVSRIKRGDSFPLEHERRVSRTFERAIMEASSSLTNKERSRPLRVLEVGIGSKCRTIFRGMYDATLNNRLDLVGLDLIGIDIELPDITTVNKARDRLVLSAEKNTIPPYPVTFDVISGDLTQGVNCPDGFFDVITSSLVLCSVEDQRVAIKEIKRLLKSGGTYGYVEHVAVNLDNENEKNRFFLEWQQTTLDPLQQRLAHNCHLHRRTDLAISDEFSGGVLEDERFFVDDMWPVSCQCCGVVRKFS